MYSCSYVYLHVICLFITYGKNGLHRGEGEEEGRRPLPKLDGDKL